MLCDKHQEAIESDLIDRGTRLRNVGGEEFNWRDFAVVVRNSSRKSALMREKHPDVYQWGQSEMLLAALVDVANLLLWAKTEDGQKNRNRPQPYPRPGIEEPGTRRVKGKAVPMDQVRARLRAVGVGNQHSA